jgi:hypothetical protein
LKRILFALMLAVMDTVPVLADEMVHIVISEDGLSEHLALNGVIARVPHGTVMRISFDYSEYHELHPYLIANQFCDDRQFLRWGAAPHPALGEIDLVCIRSSLSKPVSSPRLAAGY